MNRKLTFGLLSLTAICVAQASWAAESQQMGQTKISGIRDRDRPATSVQDWLAQIEAEIVQVTGVSVDSTDIGLEVTLTTADEKLLQIDATKFRTEGNRLIADIPKTVLALPDATEFITENPTEEIASVQVVQQEPDSISRSQIHCRTGK